MKKIFLLLLVLGTVLAGCGTSENITEESQKEIPVNGSTVEDNPSEVPAEEVTGDVDALLSNLDATIESKASAGEAVFTITVKNTSEEDINLTFTSGQKYEIYIKDTKGVEVYRYSIDKSFIMALQDLEIKAGEEVSWQEVWDYKQTGERVPSGEYTATVEIIASQINGVKVPVAHTLKAETKVSVPEENVAFRNIQVMGGNGEYKVTGEARVFEGSFFYSVEDGHEYVIQETPFLTKEGAPNWSAFEINLTIPLEKLPSNGTLTLQLFERSANDGSIVNTYHAKLEQFQ
ncbi:BsuPI-related putative proteinase inhibitor [Litchfieldia salsa]|uniref:Immunoglobulin-like domain of spore germination n=1 Tax=Litchfieldia salsa TaxID=930152 RepID=A0A1H0ULZ4_9BACI|nr:BsuPI-related putative proteinase inhibitor [Litchfieldia salsa]SDP66968.1 Immunoglobulin-like domain of spore germination [Litchfieldia salsa]